MNITEELKTKLQEARLHNIEDIQAVDVPVGMPASEVVSMLQAKKPGLFASEPPRKNVRDMSTEDYTAAKKQIKRGRG